MPVIVQKYGGSSLATPELIRSVASRICSAHDSGNSVIATVSAMGDSTDDLLSIASQVSVTPDLRELDVLLSTGELQSCALVAMALKDMGKNAVSLSGAQAGIRTDSSYGKAKIADIGPVLVACCDIEVFDLINSIGGEAIMTNPSLASGTDRVF